jgi:hypothetical protein
MTFLSALYLPVLEVQGCTPLVAVLYPQPRVPHPACPHPAVAVGRPAKGIHTPNVWSRVGG